MTSISNVSTEVPTTPAPPAVVAAPAIPEPAAPTDAVTLIDAKTAMIRDTRGRMIKVKKLSAIDRVRLFKALGAEASENRQVMNYSALAASVTELNGDHIPFPATSLQVDGLISRLDDDGLEAVVTALVKLSPELVDPVEQAKNS
jgi:hypothetical protein